MDNPSVVNADRIIRFLSDRDLRRLAERLMLQDSVTAYGLLAELQLAARAQKGN